MPNDQKPDELPDHIRFNDTLGMLKDERGEMLHIHKNNDLAQINDYAQYHYSVNELFSSRRYQGNPVIAVRKAWFGLVEGFVDNTNAKSKSGKVKSKMPSFQPVVPKFRR